MKALKAVLDGPQGEPTRSEVERMLLRALHQAGLPIPETNFALFGTERDFVWLDLGLVVETDDWNTHGDRASFERDRARDAALAARGFHTLRFTRVQIRDEILRVVSTIAAVMALRRHQAG